MNFKTHEINQVCFIPYFRNFKFVRVCSLVGGYFYNVDLVKRLKLGFSFNINDNNL